jgi:DNA polymerase I-like protein with 3'-5' exonuclease and polymerase domains
MSFEAPVLANCWKVRIKKKQVYDTLIVSRLLEPSREQGHSLENWGESLGIAKINYKAVWQWLNDRREEYKGECYDNPHMGLLEDYCIRDVEVTERLFHALELALKEKKFSNDSVTLEHEVAAIIGQQVRNGFKLDLPYATSLLTTVKRKLDSLQEQMQIRWPPYTVQRISEKTGKTLKEGVVTFNPGSRVQIGEKLISLGWKPKKFTPTDNKPIIDESTLKDCKFPEARLIEEYLMLQKRIAQITSWLEAVEEDGRVHGKVITNGAVTGRMTHSSPNMAQIPNSGSIFGPECRECWTVEEDNVLVGCDASGLELRMLAHYMKDDNYVKTVTEGSSKDGTDVHTVNQRAAGLATRDNAKTFIYAFLYGAGDSKIGSIVGGSAAAGKKLKQSFLAQTPALRKLIEAVSKYAAKGFVPGLDGRMIWVRSEHAALNSLLQGAGAIVMKKALVLFNEQIVKNKWPVKMVVNVHDEFQWETTEKYATITGEAGKQAIIDAGLFYNLRCPLDGEYKTGKSWRQTH